jgi:hypothetical protein
MRHELPKVGRLLACGSGVLLWAFARTTVDAQSRMLAQPKIATGSGVVALPVPKGAMFDISRPLASARLRLRNQLKVEALETGNVIGVYDLHSARLLDALLKSLGALKSRPL